MPSLPTPGNSTMLKDRSPGSIIQEIESAHMLITQLEDVITEISSVLNPQEVPEPAPATATDCQLAYSIRSITERIERQVAFLRTHKL